MISDAAVLEDLARWLGVVIAVVGALLANPDATAHGWATFVSHVRRGMRRSRGLLARFIPSLRRDATIHAAAGTASALSAVGSVSARVLRGWGPDATLDQRIDVLDARTLSLDKEVGDLAVQLNQVEGRLKAELADTMRVLRGEADEMRKSVEKFRRELVRSDATALPIIVVGVALSGLSPDAARVPMWLGLTALIAAVALTGWFAVRIIQSARVR